MVDRSLYFTADVPLRVLVGSAKRHGGVQLGPRSDPAHVRTPVVRRKEAPGIPSPCSASRRSR